jgi:hypothetical protein
MCFDVGRAQTRWSTIASGFQCSRRKASKVGGRNPVNTFLTNVNRRSRDSNRPPKRLNVIAFTLSMYSHYGDEHHS